MAEQDKPTEETRVCNHYGGDSGTCYLTSGKCVAKAHGDPARTHQIMKHCPAYNLGGDIARKVLQQNFYSRRIVILDEYWSRVETSKREAQEKLDILTTGLDNTLRSQIPNEDSIIE